MFTYFKGYTVGICAIAIALPVVTSTLWPMFTGQMMAASLGGTILMFALFIVGMFFGWLIFSRLADSKVQRMINAYNNDCDPDTLIREGSNIAIQVVYPCNQAASWFMGYYGQALLDSGNAQLAKNILGGLRLSIDAAKTPQEKVGILVNYLPLDEKMSGLQDALSVIDEGLGYCKEAKSSQVASFSDFLRSQKRIMQDLVSDDKQNAVDMCEKIRSDSSYPTRLRVEYAWIEASKLYGSGDKKEEANCLDFIVKNGNKLALVEKAKARLSDL